MLKTNRRAISLVRGAHLSAGISRRGSYPLEQANICILHKDIFVAEKYVRPQSARMHVGVELKWQWGAVNVEIT